MNSSIDIHAASSPIKSRDIIRAIGRLANAKKWFAHRGWDVLPDNERGQRILQWGADHAWLAGPAHPKRSVRNWCRRWAGPWLTNADLDQIVRETEKRDKRWSGDQSAMVLGITVRDREALQLWFIGADDDPHYEQRLELRRAKGAARARRFRAARATGAKRGRPALDLSPEQRSARKREQAAERQRRRRASRKKPSRDIIAISRVTHLSVTPSAERPSATAPERVSIVVRQPVLDGEIVGDGVALGAPPRPTSHLERALAWALVLHQRQQQAEMTR